MRHKRNSYLSMYKVDVYYQFVADKDEAGVLGGVGLLGDEAEEPLLGLVVRAVGEPVERVLVQDPLGLWLLDCNAVDRDGQLHLGGLGAL